MRVQARSRAMRPIASASPRVVSGDGWKHTTSNGWWESHSGAGTVDTTSVGARPLRASSSPTVEPLPVAPREHDHRVGVAERAARRPHEEGEVHGDQRYDQQARAADEDDGSAHAEERHAPRLGLLHDAPTVTTRHAGPMFVPLLEAPGPPGETSLVVAVRGNRVVLVAGEPDTPGIFLGTLAGRHCWAVDADPDADAAPRHDGDEFVDLRVLWGSVDEPTWLVAGRAVQLVEWRRTHQFCGRCGTPAEDAPGERARVCPSCGLLAYPRLAPAVIMLVERDDGRALLARNAMFPPGIFSCLSGFVEPGETAGARGAARGP